MGYRFTGFLAPAGEDVLAAALSRWPYCVSRRVPTPFRGVGVRCPDQQECTSDEEGEVVAEQVAAVEDGLAGFSRLFPGTPFVFVSVDCFGGTCSYEGFVVRSGEVEKTLPVTFGRQCLPELLDALGVRSRTGYFAPFTRGYWDSP